MNNQLVRLYQRVQEAVVEILSLRQYDVQQLFSSFGRPVTERLNFLELFLDQCIALKKIICRFPSIQFLGELFFNGQNVSL